MKLYQALFKVRFNAGLQYRGPALAAIATQFAWGFLSILLLGTVGEGVMETQHLSTYIWLQQAFITLSAVWASDSSIFTLIESGEVAYECVRPVDLYTLWFTRNLAHRISRCVLRFAPILLIGAILPEPFRMHMSVSWLNFAMFLVSLTLMLCLIIAVNMIMYGLSFFSKNVLGIRMIFMGVFEFFDGGVIPYPYFPAFIQKALSFTFFVGLKTIPFFIYMGLANPFSGIVLQIVWLIILIIVGRMILKQALNKIEIYGG